MEHVTRPGDAKAPHRQLTQPMPKLWTLDHLIRKPWSITNRSGYTTRSVRFTTCGALTLSSRINWTANIDQLDDGQGFAICGTAGWGSTINQP